MLAANNAFSRIPIVVTVTTARAVQTRVSNFKYLRSIAVLPVIE